MAILAMRTCILSCVTVKPDSLQSCNAVLLSSFFDSYQQNMYLKWLILKQPHIQSNCFPERMLVIPEETSTGLKSEQQKILGCSEWVISLQDLPETSTLLII